MVVNSCTLQSGIPSSRNASAVTSSNHRTKKIDMLCSVWVYVLGFEDVFELLGVVHHKCIEHAVPFVRRGMVRLSEEQVSQTHKFGHFGDFDSHVLLRFRLAVLVECHELIVGFLWVFGPSFTRPMAVS